jgi:hypothetical protein
MQYTPDLEVTAEQKFLKAIACRRLVTADYNGNQMCLAPHLLFARHDELFVSALNIKKNWRSDEERRLGAFKLAGLSNIAVTDDPFDPLPTFDNSVPREGDQQVFSISIT